MIRHLGPLVTALDGGSIHRPLSKKKATMKPEMRKGDIGNIHVRVAGACPSGGGPKVQLPASITGRGVNHP